MDYYMLHPLCQQYNSIASNDGLILGNGPYPSAPVGVPWLYYASKQLNLFSNQYLSGIPNIHIEIGSNPSANASLNFVLAVYSYDGYFLGMQNVTSQLQFCVDRSYQELNMWSQIGYDYDSTCSINLYSISQMAYSQTLFYELYLTQSDGTLFPIPIRLLNYQDATQGNSFINSHDDTSPFPGSTNQLTRRFFLVDTMSGFSNGSTRFIRVATSVNFWIQTSSYNGFNVILSPVLDIKYSDRLVSDITEGDTSAVSSPQFRFSAYYSADMGGFWQFMQIVFIAVSAIGGFVGLYEGRRWSTRNMGPTEPMQFRSILFMLFLVIGSIAVWYYLLLFFVCSYYLLFFKFQKTLSVILPFLSTDTSPMTGVMMTAAICQSVYVISRLFIQCTTDVFFIDWERSKGKILHHADDDSNTASGKKKAGDDGPSETKAPVGVWRLIFVANQLHSLQTYRRINVPLTLIAMYIIQIGFGLKYLATPQPIYTDLTPGKTSQILLFSINSIVWWAICAVQIAFRYIFFDRFYRHKMLQYIDALTVCNISLFIMDEPCHGYYVHGQSPHGFADTDRKELNTNLAKEEYDMLPKRGLAGTEHQSFELYLTKSLRDTFDKVYGTAVKRESTNQGLLSFFTPTRRGVIHGASEMAVQAYDGINKFFCSFFEKNLKDFQYTIREKEYIEKWLGATPPDLLVGVTNITSSLYHDELGFCKTLLYGIEADLMLLYFFIYSLVDIFGSSSYTPMLIAFIIDQLIVAARQHFGQLNISTKSIIDKKFLL